MNPAVWMDVILPVGLVVLAEVILRQRRAAEAVAQFMVFGLLMAVAWVRVDAPDLALTEAAIGSGVTGALLLAALRRIGAHREPDPPPPLMARMPIYAAMLLLGGALSWALVRLWSDPVSLTAVVHDHLAQSGSSNPVTAVILNFRAYDTLLEIGVLLLSALAVYALAGARARPPLDGPGPVFEFYLRRLAPLFALVSCYLVWVGSRMPGGAFPAGALLSGVGVLVLLGASPWPLGLHRCVVRYLLVAGFGVFLAAGIWGGRHGALLSFLPAHAKGWMLLIELACMLSIGFSFTILFACCAGWLREEGGEAA